MYTPICKDTYPKVSCIVVYVVYVQFVHSYVEIHILRLVVYVVHVQSTPIYLYIYHWIKINKRK